MDFARDFELTGKGFGFFGDSEIFQEKRLAETAAQLESYNEEIAKLQSRINNLNESGANPKLVQPLTDRLNDLTAVRDTYQELQPAIDAAAIAQARFNDAFNLVNPIMQNLVNNLAEVVKGTMSVEEAFANMLDSIGKMLAQKGAEMIATYIAIGVARIFAGLGSSSTPDVKTSGLDFSSAFSAGTGYGVSSYPGRANGGPVAANTPYIVGEREPELFVPNTAGTVYNQDQMRSAMATYSRPTALERTATSR